MALVHARTQIWHDEETGKIAHVTHHHYNPELVSGSDYAKGASADEMRAGIEEVAQGLREPDVHDLETLSALTASLHIEHFEAGLRNAQREEHAQSLDVMIDDHAAALATGTNATLDEVHARAMTLTTHIRKRVKHIQRMVDIHAKEHRDKAFASVTAEVQEHRCREIAALHAEIDAELAPKRAEHAALCDGNTKAVIEALRMQVAQHEETIAAMKAEPAAEVATIAEAAKS